MIGATHTVRVPHIIAQSDEKMPGAPPFLLTEFIESPAFDRLSWDAGRFGSQLAEMHHESVIHAGGRFGLDENNYLGASEQINGWDDRWDHFFAENRLGYQMKLAEKNAHLPSNRRKMLQHLIDKLPQLLDHLPSASLLHGDLWSGNVISDLELQAVLIDPAVYYGDREAEIAFTELFGGFPQRFYQAYNYAWPLEPGYAERRDLYNLYHLLNHLNLFGDSYAGAVDSILGYYVG